MTSEIKDSQNTEGSVTDDQGGTTMKSPDEENRMKRQVSTPYLLEFKTNFIEKGIELSGAKHEPVNVLEIISIAKKCVKERFSSGDMQGTVIRNASEILNIQAWPSCSTALAMFGNNSVLSLFNHFQLLLLPNFDEPETEIDALDQFQSLKMAITKQFKHQLVSTCSVTEVWQQILTSQELAEMYPVIIHLIKLISVLPISNAVVERMFSTMNRVVTVDRSSLGNSRISALVRISADSPDLSQFDVEPALTKWMEKKNRRGSYQTKRNVDDGGAQMLKRKKAEGESESESDTDIQ
ncbi:uncharacterized protein LOC121374886 isoform X4 [Gigantopelta aegis]|nr:uncharacterized protein LOC121374886 isoform X4 [Gigantopelta aegis]